MIQRINVEKGGIDMTEAELLKEVVKHTFISVVGTLYLVVCLSTLDMVEFGRVAEEISNSRTNLNEMWKQYWG